MIEVTIGEIIKETRKKLGLTQEEVSFGICEPATLSRVENNKTTPTRNVVNALLQRLDISDDRFYAAINIEELRINELCKEITACNVEYERTCIEERNPIREKLRKKHQELRDILESDDKITEQFIIRSEILIGDYTPQEKIDRLSEALRLTHPNFNLTLIKKGLYSFDEIKIINQIAAAYSDDGKSEQALEVWENLLANIENRYEFIVPSRTQKEMILYGLSREYLIVGDYIKALFYAREGKELVVKHGLYRHLPGFVIILAECEHQLGNDIVSRELFEDAYHLCKVIGDKSNEMIVVKAQKEYFSNTF